MYVLALECCAIVVTDSETATAKERDLLLYRFNAHKFVVNGLRVLVRFAFFFVCSRPVFNYGRYGRAM